MCSFSILIVKFKDKQEQTVKCSDADDESRQLDRVQGLDQAAKVTVFRAHMVHELETRWNRTPYEAKKVET